MQIWPVYCYIKFLKISVNSHWSKKNKSVKCWYLDPLIRSSILFFLLNCPTVPCEPSPPLWLSSGHFCFWNSSFNLYVNFIKPISHYKYLFCCLPLGQSPWCWLWNTCCNFLFICEVYITISYPRDYLNKNYCERDERPTLNLKQNSPRLLLLMMITD